MYTAVRPIIYIWGIHDQQGFFAVGEKNERKRRQRRRRIS